MTKINEFLKTANHFLPANESNFKLGLICILLNRSLLIEDVPGMGKTTFVKFFAKTCGLSFQRVQFTSDLLPSDILGVSIFQKESSEFIFKKGPIFSELILADELNRGTPKVQSALLEALEEKQVSIDGKSYPLPERFCLMATQNPRGQFGTYPLPESQLDRFLFKISMGKLTRENEMQLLIEEGRGEQLLALEKLFTHENLNEWSQGIKNVQTSQNILEYILDLIEKTRSTADVSSLSPRATRDLLDAARAHAFIVGRTFLIPDDVQFVFPYLAGHRLFNTQSYAQAFEFARAREIMQEVPVRPR
jgi:MoxR-like ATPase